MHFWNRSVRLAVLAIAFLGLAAIPRAEAGTSCKEILTCAMDTGRGFMPKDICDACNSEDSVREVIAKFDSVLEDPSVASACGGANSVKWIKDNLTSGLEGGVKSLICVFDPDAGTVDSKTCDRDCESNCGASTMSQIRDFFLRLFGGVPADQSSVQDAEAEFERCRLKCGCGMDKLVCEEGAARLAEMACKAMGLEDVEAPKKSVGSECEWDSDCENDACGRATAAEGAGKVCCPSGSAPMYAGFDYCSEMADGSRCWSDAMCASQICADNAGGTKRGTCTSKRAVGADCTSNDECANDACGRATAADNTPTTCCASGELRNYGGFDYCASMPNGSVCWSDAMCSSGYCKGNLSGLRKGKCS